MHKGNLCQSQGHLCISLPRYYCKGTFWAFFFFLSFSFAVKDRKFLDRKRFPPRRSEAAQIPTDYKFEHGSSRHWSFPIVVSSLVKKYETTATTCRDVQSTQVYVEEMRKGPFNPTPESCWTAPIVVGPSDQAPCFPYSRSPPDVAGFWHGCSIGVTVVLSRWSGGSNSSRVRYSS